MSDSYGVRKPHLIRPDRGFPDSKETGIGRREGRIFNLELIGER